MIRADGRSSTDYRPISFSLNDLPVANGSSVVKIGNTEVLASLKGEIGSPLSDRVAGRLFFNINCDQAFAGDNTQYKLLERDLESLMTFAFLGQTNSSADMFFSSLHDSSLVIEPEKLVWDIYVDISVLAVDGNFSDACFLATRLAFGAAKLPVVQLSSLDTITLDTDGSLLDLNTERLPLSCSLYHYKSMFIADPLPEEMEVSLGFVMLSGLQDGTICLCQKSGSSLFSDTSFSNLVSLGGEVLETLFRKVSQFEG
ncbi:hypothetical protein GEMRC1_007992 [Eukaryota sp. GEM-RC1]